MFKNQYNLSKQLQYQKPYWFSQSVVFIISHCIVCILLCCESSATHTKLNHYPTSNLDKYASIVVDVKRLKVLHQYNAIAKRHPASLTKMMTIYLTFDALQKKKITLHQKIKVSKLASMQKPSILGLKPGEYITVKDAIYAMIVKSANDATFAIAETLGNGNVNKFIMMMNRKAKQVGMHNTRFMTPHGWHHAKQYTTAYDMAKLAIALRKYHGRYYKMFSSKSFTFKGKVIKTHNKVLSHQIGIDGLKTGFTIPSGFNIATSMKNRNSNIVTIVMGGDSAKSRDEHVMYLINRFLPNTTKKKITRNV